MYEKYENFFGIKRNKNFFRRKRKRKNRLGYKKTFDGWWHCRYKYTSIKNSVEISLSCKWSCKDEYSAVYYAVKAAKLDIESCLNKKIPKYYSQLLEYGWKKYDDIKKLHHKILNRLFFKGNEYVQ